jgi:ankyrin repeat protein
MGGHLETVKVLLAGRADVNAKDQMGRTALVYAKERGNTEVVALLKKLEKGKEK